MYRLYQILPSSLQGNVQLEGRVTNQILGVEWGYWVWKLKVSLVQILNFAAYLYFLFGGVKFNFSVTLSGT